jgi:CRISPR-associated protein Cmr5
MSAQIKPKLTLEQKRAQDAWDKCASYIDDDHVNLAKGLPALIMSSGLMQVMAFLHEKGKKESQRHCAVVGGHLREWLQKRFANLPSDFNGFMVALMCSEAREYQAITIEALAWLRWLRQMAAARKGVK